MNFIQRLNAIVEKIIRICLESSSAFNEVFVLDFITFELSTYNRSQPSVSMVPLLKLVEIKNYKDLEFVFQYLISENYIKLEYQRNHKHSIFSITVDGLLFYNTLSEDSIESRNVFIAMSFTESEKWIYSEAIFPVLNKLGYNALKVDDLQTLKLINNDITINDFIIALIKQSKFCIADLTSNKNGVYFEAGYAMARGKHVIFTCHKSDFNNVHFDTNHYPIIFYEDSQDLVQNLEAHIMARIEF